MACSPNKLTRAKLFLVLFPGLVYLAAGATDVVAAQQADPAAQALPNQAPPPADQAPQSILPVPVSPDTPAPPLTQPGSGSGITVDALAQVDPSSVGVIDPSTGGFSSDMWARSDRPVIERLIPQLPTGSQSPAMQALLRRLLLTAAVVPQGAAGTPGLLVLRLDRLAQAGDLPDTLDLLGRLSPDVKDIGISKLKVNALLLAGELLAACDETENIVQADPDPYWTEVLGYCHVLKGNMAAAGLAVEMLQDKGVNAPLYYQLMARLTAGDVAKKPAVDLGKFNKPDPLLISMIQTAGLEIPVAVLPNASPLMVQALATGASLPLELRLPAAERAASHGSLSPEKLAEVYGAVTFTPEEREKVLDLASSATDSQSARVNALLYQAALAAPDITARGPLLQAIWTRAKKLGMTALAARVNAEAVTGLEPSAEALPYVKEIGRLLLLAGKYERFSQWYEFLRLRASTDDKDSAAAMQDLWPLATIADTGKALPWSADTVDQWWQSQLTAGQPDPQGRAALLFSIQEALGYQISDAAWARLVEGAPLEETALPALPYWRALAGAAKDKRLGETVILSLISLGDAGPDKASPLVVGKVIAALEAVGLDAPARQIAIEALVARDF